MRAPGLSPAATGQRESRCSCAQVDGLRADDDDGLALLGQRF
jgi:hypothetical protein